MNKNLPKIFARSNETVQVVLDRMNAIRKVDPTMPRGIALIVDTKNRLTGIVTDGDVRRAFAKGVTVKDPISKVTNKKPDTIIAETYPSDILPVLFDKIKAGLWPRNRLDKIIVTNRAGQVLDLVTMYELLHKSDARFKHIGVLGLGYVGLTLALTLSDLGFKVKGFDIDPRVMRSLKNGTAHFYEKGLQELLTKELLTTETKRNFVVVDGFSGINNCDVYFVAVGTPLNSQNRPRLDLVEKASRMIGKVLKTGDTVILRSTVPVGTTRRVIIPILEKASKLKAGEDFQVAFAPERTIEGKALEELKTLPQVIGGLNHASTDTVANIFSFLTRSTVIVDSLEAAEMVKLINNVYRDVNFALANEVSLIAEPWGINTKKLIEAANYGYERSKIPVPSPGVGGCCLEKDPYILAESARLKGYRTRLPLDARKVSDTMVGKIFSDVVSFLKREKKGMNAKIFVLGLTFKGRPVTSDLRGSTSLQLVKKLQARGFKNIHGYDPAVRKGALSVYGVRAVSKPAAGFKGADVVLIMNNNPEFETLKLEKLVPSGKKPIFFFDGWNVLDASIGAALPGVTYKVL